MSTKLAKEVLVAHEMFKSYKYTIPEFINYSIRLGLLEDASWHNDTMPSYRFKDSPEDEDARVWVDHANPDDREEENDRYCVSFHDPDEGYVVLFSDENTDEFIEYLVDHNFDTEQQKSFKELTNA